MISKDSFAFDGVDMLERWGIRMVASDVLMPRMRARRVTVPGRDGAYDYGPGRYEDRTVRLACDSRRGLSRQELRALAGHLARKGRLQLWDEPDKYYIARLYDEAVLSQIGRVGQAFELAFVCEPFAVGELAEAPVGGRVTYEGTAQTGVRLVIRNTGKQAVRGIRMVIRRIGQA